MMLFRPDDPADKATQQYAEVAARLGDTLVKQGMITEVQLLTALQEQKNTDKKLGQIFISKGLITRRQLAETLAKMYQLPMVDLAKIEIQENLLGLFPYELLQNYGVVPISLEENFLTVAIHDPLEIDALQELRYISGYQIKPVVADEDQIHQWLDERQDAFRTIEVISDLQSGEKQEGSIIRLVEVMLIRAVNERASDIHIELQKDKMRVRHRIDGELYEKLSVPKEIHRKVISRVKVMANMDLAETRHPQDGRFSFTVSEVEYDIRVSSIPDIMGENMVLRILNKQYIHRPIETLGLEDDEIKVIRRLIRRPYGMILATGPTGAGKTTTLYSILNTLNKPNKSIITIEDPVEYELPGISQTHINPQAGYTFARAIRHILRHDPNIIMVGEIRDPETAEIAIRAALTGHLVLSTLHTNSAPGAVTRLLDMGIQPFLISSAVIGVIAQRLVRRLCPECKRMYEPSLDEKQEFESLVGSAQDMVLAEPVGCEKCFKTGYMGREGLFEVLTIDQNIRKLIVQHGNEQDIKQSAIQNGMKTLKMAGMRKALKRITTVQEVLGATLTEEDD